MLFGANEIPAQTRARVNALAERGRLPQSVLLTGGSEKLREKCAMELAGAVMCENRKNGAPCGKCPACIKLKAGTHPDLIAVKPAKDRKTVSIDQVRSLVLDTLYLAPNEAENKAYLFYGAEELSPLIQNALLKTIEEPPPYAMFLFLCDQRDQLLNTVVSRVTEFSLGDVLTAERKNKEEEISNIAAGYVKALCGGNEYDIMKSTAPLAKNRALMKKVAERIILIVRDAAAFPAGEIMSGCEEAAVALHGAFDAPALFALKEAMEKIASWAAANANENLMQTLFSSMGAELLKKRRI